MRVHCDIGWAKPVGCECQPGWAGEFTSSHEPKEGSATCCPEHSGIILALLGCMGPHLNLCEQNLRSDGTLTQSGIGDRELVDTPEHISQHRESLNVLVWETINDPQKMDATQIGPD